MKLQLRVTFRDRARTPDQWQQQFNHDTLATAMAGRDAMAKHPKAIRIETWGLIETWEKQDMPPKN